MQFTWPVILVVASMLTAPSGATGQCVDYLDYSHILGSVDIYGRAAAFSDDGRLAYLVGASALYVVDISDPVSPLTLGTLTGYFVDIELRDHHALLTHSGLGLVTVDVSDPAAPVAVDTVMTRHGPRGLAVVDSVAYVSYGLRDSYDRYYGGFVVVSVADPSEARLLTDRYLAYGMGIAANDSAGPANQRFRCSITWLAT